MPQRKPLGERTTASGRPARPRAITGAILLLVAVSLLVGLPVHLIWSEARVAAAEDELRRDGVKLTGELEFLYPQKVGRRIEDRVLVTYEYEGKSYSVGFTCDDCRHDKEPPVWIDPDDPNVYVTAYISTANKASVPATAILVLLAFPAFVTAGIVIKHRHWWLSIPEVKKRRRRPAR